MKIKLICGGAASLLTGLALTFALAGCVGPGYVDVGVPGPYIEPDVYVFGGYGRGHFDREGSHRGFESRSFVPHSAPHPGFGGSHHR